MNRRSSGSLTISKAITGFVNYKLAEGLSQHTVDSYERILAQWLEYQQDVPIGDISSKEITTYLTWLRTEYVPRRLSGNTNPLSPKTLRNFYITLSSFFTWAKIEFQIKSPMTDVPSPRFQIYHAPADSQSRPGHHPGAHGYWPQISRIMFAQNRRCGYKNWTSGSAAWI